MCRGPTKSRRTQDGPSTALVCDTRDVNTGPKILHSGRPLFYWSTTTLNRKRLSFGHRTFHRSLLTRWASCPLLRVGPATSIVPGYSILLPPETTLDTVVPVYDVGPQVKNEKDTGLTPHRGELKSLPPSYGSSGPGIYPFPRTTPGSCPVSESPETHVS